MAEALTRVDCIVLHCSDTEDGPGLSAEAIRAYHMSYRHKGAVVSAAEAERLRSAGEHVEPPWSDCGYHVIVEAYGTSIVVEPGRPLYLQGAHCAAAGRNHDSIGVCVVGQYDAERPGVALWDSVVHTVAWLALLFHVPPEHVIGHREVDPGKTCPGAMWDMKAFRAAVQDRTKHGLLFLGWTNT